jgi:hypothetical protein
VRTIMAHALRSRLHLLRLLYRPSIETLKQICHINAINTSSGHRLRVVCYLCNDDGRTAQNRTSTEPEQQQGNRTTGFAVAEALRCRVVGRVVSCEVARVSFGQKPQPARGGTTSSSGCQVAATT